MQITIKDSERHFTVEGDLRIPLINTHIDWRNQYGPGWPVNDEVRDLVSQFQYDLHEIFRRNKVTSERL